MDKDTIQQIRDWAEAAANRLPYGKDNVVFSGLEIMELLDLLSSKEAEVERLRAALLEISISLRIARRALKDEED